MMHEDESYHRSGKSGSMIKKCPECYAYMPLHTNKCPSCSTKLGDVDKLGFATRPFDWAGYLIAIVSIVGLVVFVWWGFFKD